MVRYHILYLQLIQQAKVRRDTITAGTWRAKIQTSTDDIVWTDNGASVNVAGDSDAELVGTSHSHRYVRVQAEHITSDDTDQDFGAYEIYNGDLFGGTARVSLEMQDSESGNWIEIEGLGATDLIGSHERTSFPPRTATDIRLRLVITGGGTDTSVSITKSA